MGILETIAIIMLVVQFAHSGEELLTGFHRRWYLTKLPFSYFLAFEILHNLFWTAVILLNYFPLRIYLLGSFVVLMFANGIQHLVWAGMVKKYVPGLITAPVHVILFLVLYFLMLRT